MWKWAHRLVMWPEEGNKVLTTWAGYALSPEEGTWHRLGGLGWLESKGASSQKQRTPLGLLWSVQVCLSFILSLHLSLFICSLWWYFSARLPALRHRDQMRKMRWMLLLTAGLSSRAQFHWEIRPPPPAAPGSVWVEESSPKNASTIVGELLLPAAPCVIWTKRIRVCLQVSLGNAPFPQT